MNDKILKKRLYAHLACLLTVQLLTFSSNIWAASGNGGVIGGGGGDAAEIRVNEIRSDILKWINDGGAKGLNLPSEISYGEYFSNMSEILQPKKVVLEFTEEKVVVNKAEKTCRGFMSDIDSKPHMLCNISRFEKTAASEQYKLIHHEYAGLVNVERNEGAASDYIVSSQITDFLSEQTVLRLAVKKANNSNAQHSNYSKFDHPLINKKNTWSEAGGDFPIIYSNRNARIFCLLKGFDDYDSNTLKSEKFYVRDMNGTAVAVQSISPTELVMATIEKWSFFSGEIIASVTCVKKTSDE